jgi:hypothetical protein
MARTRRARLALTEDITRVAHSSSAETMAWLILNANSATHCGTSSATSLRYHVIPGIPRIDVLVLQAADQLTSDACAFICTESQFFLENTRRVSHDGHSTLQAAMRPARKAARKRRWGRQYLAAPTLNSRLPSARIRPLGPRQAGFGITVDRRGSAPLLGNQTKHGSSRGVTSTHRRRIGTLAPNADMNTDHHQQKVSRGGTSRHAFLLILSVYYDDCSSGGHEAARAEASRHVHYYHLHTIEVVGSSPTAPTK